MPITLKLVSRLYTKRNHLISFYSYLHVCRLHSAIFVKIKDFISFTF